MATTKRLSDRNFDTITEILNHLNFISHKFDKKIITKNIIPAKKLRCNMCFYFSCLLMDKGTIQLLKSKVILSNNVYIHL